jgi:hypothetical protein
MLRPVHGLLSDEGFRVALVAAALGVVLVVVLIRRDVVLLGHPFVAVVATLLGFRVEHRLGAPLVVGLALLVVGDWLATATGTWAARLTFAVPGALVLGASLPEGFAFSLRTTVVVAIVLLAPLVVVFATRDPRLAAAMFAVSAVGLYACVPDTEHAKVLLAALVIAGALGIDPRLPATVGVSALTGLFVWTSAVGGHGRPGSVLGAIACLGVLVVGPLAGWARVGRASPWLVIPVQVALVAYLSRAAGFQETVAGAAALAVPALAVVGAVLAIAVRRQAGATRR